MIPSVKRALFRKFKAVETRRHELSYLFWECTTRCNLDCLHCGSDCSKQSNYRDMPMEDFLKALDTIKNPAKNLMVVVTGGEPLLRKDLPACGREIRRRGMRWSMVSNGYFYDEAVHNSLLNAGLGALTISLDGLPESHNWLRNNPRSFDRAVAAIDLAVRSLRLNFDVVTCVNKKNISELSLIKEFLKSHKVKAWRLFTIIPIGRAVQNEELSLSDEEFVYLMDFIRELRENEGDIDVKFSCEGFVGKYEWKVRESFYFCRAGINIGSILIDGSISACPNIDRSFSQGNIYTDNFNDVWEQRFNSFRDRNWMRVGQCKDCRRFKDCQGSGFHNWHGSKQNVLVCHRSKIENAHY
jgi:radical SAM enzyme (rSAM/lipoprotein system)